MRDHGALSLQVLFKFSLKSSLLRSQLRDGVVDDLEQKRPRFDFIRRSEFVDISLVQAVAVVLVAGLVHVAFEFAKRILEQRLDHVAGLQDLGEFFLVNSLRRLLAQKA